MHLRDDELESAILWNAERDLAEAGVDGPDPRWRLATGAARFRRGDHAGALERWTGLDDPTLAPLARRWSALALARLGRLEEALAHAGGHLRGEVLCALGRVDEGLAAMAEARAADPLAEWRVERLAGWLVRAGRGEEAARLVTERLARPARFEAELRAAAGEAVTVAPEPFPEGEGPAVGVVPGPAMWAALGESRAWEEVGTVPVRAPRAAGMDPPARWMRHPERPGEVALCLHPAIPAWLWPVGPDTPEGRAALVAPYARGWVPDEPRLADLSERLRLFLGRDATLPDPYTGAEVPLDRAAFTRVAGVSPFFEPVGWGTGKVEDPHVHFVDRGGLDRVIAGRRAQAADRERPPGASWRLRWSRSVLTLEQYEVGWVAELRYRPSPHPGQVDALGARFGLRFPDALPLDAVGVLMGFPAAEDAAALRATIHAELADEDRWRVYALGALLHPDDALDRWLAEAPEALAEDLQEVAWTYGRLGWLLRRAARDPRLVQGLQTGPHADVLLPRPS